MTWQRVTFGVGMLALIAVGVALMGLIYFLAQMYAAADYPGARQVSDHMTWHTGRDLSLRRDTSYRTNDPFNDVYHWYSAGFSLGPEERAMSNCILLEDNNRMLMLNNHMSVFLCSTQNGQMIFVERTMSLRLR